MIATALLIADSGFDNHMGDWGAGELTTGEIANMSGSKQGQYMGGQQMGGE